MPIGISPSPPKQQSSPPLENFETMVTNILGHSFRGNSVVRIGLASKIFGLGVKQAGFLCSKLGIYPNMRMHELTEPKVLAITKELSELKVGNDLKNEILGNIRLKRQIGSYAGRRHQAGLPVRGQRTRTNAQTAKRLNRVNRHIKAE